MGGPDRLVRRYWLSTDKVLIEMYLVLAGNQLYNCHCHMSQAWVQGAAAVGV